MGEMTQSGEGHNPPARSKLMPPSHASYFPHKYFVLKADTLLNDFDFGPLLALFLLIGLPYRVYLHLKLWPKQGS